MGRGAGDGEYLVGNCTTITRALSLRNLVSGCECGRVFPAGVGPGSPSREMQPTCGLRDSTGRLRLGGGMGG